MAKLVKLTCIDQNTLARLGVRTGPNDLVMLGVASTQGNRCRCSERSVPFSQHNIPISRVRLDEQSGKI